MKRFIKMSLILLMTPIMSHAQWNYNGASVYYNNGNVGIGTSAPSNIQGWSRVLDVSGSGHAKILATTNDGVYRMGMYAHVNGWYEGGGFIGTESNHNLYFNTNYDPKMVLTTSGNFGVGTLTPSNKLDVNGIIGINGTPVINTGNSANDIYINSRVIRNESTALTDGMYINYNSTGGVSAHLKFYANGTTERMRIDASTGNVGIGTSTPYSSARLHAKSPAANPWGILTEANSNDKVIALGHDGSSGVIATSYLSTGGWSPLQFRTQNLARMTIIEDGNVGIGTETPDSKLTVKGIIHTQEVKVDLNGSVAPDYVFEKDYPLTSLEELKSYIEQNKHLPEVPSAKEMEEEGINLKEMNLLLLRKIEEMTLHLIDQNQQYAQLKEESRVSAEASAKKVEELTLHLIRIEGRLENLSKENEYLRHKN
ncbi:MAG TPA: tail fiber protein [Cyclobacteriaceae bacterium]|nr:tail fiber protein [Cyclobacteriaceae bacterium]